MPQHDPLPRASAPLPSTAEEVRRRQKSRSVVMALLLGGFVALLFAITIVKIRAGMHP